ncbi:hypothetical protein L1049_009829 [Liquidambar formosana]|uniref:Uncharacterized protein n=1 Tax=Liquidambar formosana TaxID=63359 RepID=A0AAP0R3U8_LIQFO
MHGCTNASALPSDNCNALRTPNVLALPPKAYLGSKHKGGTAAVRPLAIVVSKKQGGGSGLLRRLLRRRKGSNRKTFLTFGKSFFMAFFSSFFSCFSDSSRVACEEDGGYAQSRAAVARGIDEAKSKNKSRRSPPIPVTYFPIGTRFSRL